MTHRFFSLLFLTVGEASGKALRGIAKYSARNAMSEIGRAKQAAIQRGEKLEQLNDATEKMRTNAQEFARNAHMLKNKYKNKKWWQF